MGEHKMQEKSAKSVLLVEDNSGDARLLCEMLNEQGASDIELAVVGCMSEAEQYLAEHAVDIILLDLGLPDAQGLVAIRRAHAAAPDSCLVVLTGLDDESLAEQALQEGAQDYLIKGKIDISGLMRALRYCTQRKRLERLKDEFISSVSHELRTPLTSISAALGLLMGKESNNLSPPVVRLLNIANSNSKRLVRLVNDILDIEKMESGHVSFIFGRVEVRPLVQLAIEANQAFAEGYNVRLRLDGPSTICAVRADADRLTQVVTNLLSNAVKFSPPGEEVVVKVEKQDESVHISVRDSGRGIPEEFKSQVFERFAQADATNTREKGGTGLGLSIVKQIVDRLAGTVGFKDATGGGTIFYVDLPSWIPADSLRSKDKEAA